MSSSSSFSSCSLPYFCPGCGKDQRFSSIQQLRTHLVSQHTYQTLMLLSQARVRQSGPGSVLPLPSPAVPKEPVSLLGLDWRHLPLPLACLDLASSSASIQILRDMFGRSTYPVEITDKDPEQFSSALALRGSLEENLGDEGLAVGVGLEERLGLDLDLKIARTFAEVEERVTRRMARLKVALERREAELEQERHEGERLERERQDVEERAAYLARQVSVAMEMMERLRRDLDEKERELSERQQEMVDIECFLRETAEKEAEAKARLQVFIETLLERADRAERQLLLHTSYTHHDKYTHTDRHTPSPGRSGRSLDGSTDDIIGTLSNRRSYSMSGDQFYSDGVLSGRMRTLSLNGDTLDLPLSSCPPQRTERLWRGQAGWGRTWNKTNHHQHSTEEEEEGEGEVSWSTQVMRRTYTPGTDVTSSLHSTPSSCHGDCRLRAGTLRLRAGLFCVFPYLDTPSLLLAAEVCSDWRFVARHPAVWTRLHLENARVSAKFLITLSQWCTQVHSVILTNLKSRARRPSESRTDYYKNTRGGLEVGVEALLRSAGGSLGFLSVSQCDHILTDRALWLTSCYCRNLHTLIYKSSSDPLGHEVVWALGAGCRNITSLQVAPAHPCQQPTRFNNRCLQTIGRCWPHLHSLSVGGAGCGSQGLAAVVRSCVHLQILELERVADLSLQVATEMCREGLRNLEVLIFRHTPVSGQAVLHFHDVCGKLRSILVEVSVSDYFEDPDTEEAQTLFGDIFATLQVLQQHPGLCDILRVKAEGHC
ncbi:F-box only protein 41-like [Lampris incognitus]|uniref:F-box only protein 41-like n=1 Tax=Lampris incognitus TaxID=2546036 RepID=UPI0024B60FAA|nr:F-box only protein 41-like [Lampris incognitus]